MKQKLQIIIVVLGLLLPAVVWRQYSRSQVHVSQSISQSYTTVDTHDTTESDASNSFLESLRRRSYEPSQISIEDIVGDVGLYTGYIVSYVSDGLKIYGRMNVPNSGDPAEGFPVIILNHGYFNQSSFTSGDGTQTMADILARNGYLTLASDYRGFGRSDNDEQGSRGHNPNYAIDILHLIASIPSLDNVDVTKIGMWGHSMGGEVTLRTAEATDKLKAIVLWATTSGRSSDNARFYSGRHSESTTRVDDGGTSPIDYLQYITSPISLHQGLADTEVNPEWADQLHQALRDSGKEVEYFTYPGQDHNFRNPGWDTISTRTIEFFDTHLKK